MTQLSLFGRCDCAEVSGVLRKSPCKSLISLTCGLPRGSLAEVRKSPCKSLILLAEVFLRKCGSLAL